MKVAELDQGFVDCLEFDTLAQADDPEVAFELLVQSTDDIVLEDLRAGMNPLERRAPLDGEGWSLLRFVTERPDSTQLGSAASREIWQEVRNQAEQAQVVIAVQFFLGYQRSAASSRLASEAARQTLLQARRRSSVACVV